MRSTLAWFSLAVVPLIAACGDNIKSSGDPDAGLSQPDAAPEPGDPTTGAWTAGFELPGVSGAGSRVEAVELAADGTLYAAGIFLDASAVPAANIAHWTGTDWEPLGAGLDGWVRAIEFDAAGTLWAAVTDNTDLTGALMRWTGTAWETANTLDGAIRDLAVVDTGIAVVGDFTGSVRVLDLSDDSWIDVTPDGINGAAGAVAARPGGGFCVAGTFDSIDSVAVENAACWSGTTWTPLGAGLPGGVNVLARSPGGAWFAGGTLTFTVNPETGEYEAGIARLSGGTWAPFQGGIDNGFINEVRAIAFDGDDILVGGHFQTAGTTDVPVQHLARFTPGSGWSRVGGGLVNSIGVFLPSIVGTGDLAVAADGTIYVGGLFTAAGGVPAVSIARIPTTGAPTPLVGPHTVLGVGGFVDTVAASAAGLIVGGGFAFAGQVPLDNIGVLAGDTWTALGSLEGIVRDVLVLDDGVVAVAGELYIGGELAAYAEWDGTAWQTPGGRVEGFGFALARDPDGTIWLGGDLFTAGATALANLAHLEHGTWSAGGMFDGRVNALAFEDAGLLAGGSFTTIDGAPARALAIRNPTTGEWLEHGGVDGDFPGVYAIAVSPLGIIVGGEFTGVGGVVAEDLAVWSGGAWHDLGAGFNHDDFSFVSTLYAYGDGVFVGGGFRTIGGVATSNIGWYDGTQWHALGAGLQDLSEEMVVIDRVLYVGGPFTAAGDHPSAGLARWDFR